MSCPACSRKYRSSAATPDEKAARGWWLPSGSKVNRGSRIGSPPTFSILPRGGAQRRIGGPRVEQRLDEDLAVPRGQRDDLVVADVALGRILCAPHQVLAEAAPAQLRRPLDERLLL